MSEWKLIKTKKDIDELMEYFYGFHDTCINSISYVSGNKVNEDRSMVFGTLDDYKLNIVFDSQWKSQIELCFTGVRRMHLVGLEDNYSNDIFDASISFYNNILPSKHFVPKKVIVWADDSNFDIKDIDNSLSEPSITYIIAHELKWRKID